MRVSLLLTGCFLLVLEAVVGSQLCNNPANLGNRFPHPGRCDAFVRCETGGRERRILCPKAPKNNPLVGGQERLFFNPKIQVCDWPQRVKCNNNGGGDGGDGGIPKIQKTCFGAKDDSPGSFKVRAGGRITEIKLTRTSGTVTCDARKPGSFWGCSGHFDGYLGVVVAINRKVIFPPKGTIKINRYGFYMYEDPHGQYYSQNSPSLQLKFDQSFKVPKGTDELKVWYGEDLLNGRENINVGKTCIDVEVTYA